MALSPYMGQSYGLSPKLSYLCWRESTQRFSAQSKDCLLDARYLLCVISLVLAASPPSSHRQLAFVNSIAIMDSSTGTPGQLQCDCWLHPGVEGTARGSEPPLHLGPSCQSAGMHITVGSLLPSDFSLFIPTCRSAWIVYSF